MYAAIPEIEYDISPGEPTLIKNFECCAVLGKGALGMVL